MKLGSMTVLALSWAFVSSGSFPTLWAQGASVPAASDVYQCMKWMKAVVPDLRTPSDGDLRKLDAAHFCGGIQEGGMGSWGAVFKCGQPAKQFSGTPLNYCASFGEVHAGAAWAVGFSSTTKDGSDLLEGASDTVKDSQHAAVTFYTTNSVWMEGLQLPAGMYKLIPSRSSDGWRLVVAKKGGEWSDVRHTQQYLGSVELSRAASDHPPGKNNLTISLGPGVERCPSASVQRDVKEVHFTYASTDLFVCFRSDQRQEENTEER
jgi:Protein of unknown function (DUF2911)